MIDEKKDKHIFLDQIILEIRKRMRALWTREKIVDDMCNHRVPSDIVFICYAAAVIMEKDYGRTIP